MKSGWFLLAMLALAPVDTGALGQRTASPGPFGESGGAELLFLGYKGRDEIGPLPDFIRDYQLQRPDVRVQYEYIAESYGYYDALKIRLASGEKVDLFMSDFRYIKLYVEAGYVMDLTGKPVDLGLAHSYRQNVLYGFRRDVVYNGRIYCFPFSAAGIGLFANRSLLEEAGREYPRRWGDFLETCAALEERGVLPLIMGNKQGRSGTYFLRTAMRLEQKEPGFPEDAVLDGSLPLSQLFASPLEKLALLLRRGYINGPGSVNLQINPQVMGDFQKGDAAFMIGGTWQINQIIREDAPYDFTFGPLPVNEEDEGYAVLFPVENLFINARTEHPEEALQFLHFLALPWNAGAWARSQAAFPTIVDAGAYEYVSEKETPFSEAYQAGRILGWSKVMTELQIEQELERGIAPFMLGEMSAREFGERLDAYQIRQIVAE